MFVCRTLDYIVDTDLHLYLFAKFDSMRSKGIQVGIELTEPINHIPMDSTKYIEIIDTILDSAIESLCESTDKRINFYMFYTGSELNLVIHYPFENEKSSKTLDAMIKKHKNVYFFTNNEKGTTIQYLIVH